MNDRELLELAAKAVGGFDRCVYMDGHLSDDAGFIGEGIFVEDGLNSFAWNPLTDDGDAFRLASELNLTVEFGNSCVQYPFDMGGDGMEPLKATRQAIVRAAAAIGKDMP